MSPRSFIQRHWPVPLALAVYDALVALLFAACTQPGGLFIYPLDDAYIHLAHGRSLGLHGVWGATSHAFSSSTSSPLWTLLLAAWFRIAGPWELAPVALNLIFGTCLVIVVHRFLRARIRSTLAEAPFLVLFVLVLPLPVMTIIGMEHTLQVLLTVLFLGVFQASLREINQQSAICNLQLKNPQSAFRNPQSEASMSLPAEATYFNPHSAIRNPQSLWFLAALLVATRYEMLFLIAFAGLFLLGLRQWRAGLSLWAAAWVPVLVYGAVSIAHGGWLLPNTLLLKGNMPQGVLATLRRCFAVLQVNLSVYVLLLMAAAAWAVNNSRPWPRQRENNFLLLLFIGTTVLHTWLAQYGFHFRYEAYLVALGILVLVNFLFTFPFGFGEAPLRQKVWVWGAAACLGWLALIPFFPRAINSIRFTPIASRNVYQQQYQMARFLKHYFPGVPVAVNDIGLVCWLADPPLFDAWGLATQPVADAKRKGTYDRAALDRLTREAGVKLAVIYEPWFSDKIPAAWQKVGQWRIQDNYICAIDTVTFYAVKPAQAPKLAEKLKAFAPQLPPAVLQSGAYFSDFINSR